MRMEKHASQLVGLVLLLIWLAGPEKEAFAQNAPDSLRMARVGQVTYGTTLNDVWGYVDSTGHEYALVGTGLGASIVDLVIPSQPQELFYFPRPYSLWRDLVEYRGFAYVSNETGLGLQIIDLRFLPDSAPVKDVIIEDVETAHNLYVDSAGYLYVVGTDQFDGGMMILDLNADPWNPEFVGSYSLDYVHDVYVRNDTAYSAELTTGLTVIDLQNRSEPTVIGNQTYPGGFTHNTWLSDNGKVCYTTDEIYGGYTIAWDVSDPSNIRELDRIRATLSSGNAAPHNVHVYQDYLVVSHYRDGVWVFDASRPDNLTTVAYYDTSPKKGSGFDGCWGAYPFLPSGLLLATDVDEGLVILQVEYQRAAYWDLLVLDDSLNTPLDGVEIWIEGELVGQTDEQGLYSLAKADSGLFMAQLVKPGFLDDSVLVSLSPGQTQEDTVLLRSFPRSDLRIIVKDTEGSPVPAAIIKSEVEVQGMKETYEWLTQEDGSLDKTYILAGSHRMVVGKWGLFTQEVFADLQQGRINELVITLPIGYRDEFALDLGWEVESSQDEGAWTLAEPMGTYLPTGALYIINPDSDVQGDLGTSAYFTGANDFEFEPPERNDLDNGYTRLVSPEIDLTQFELPMVRFHFWLTNLNLSGSNFYKGQGKLVVNQLYEELIFERMSLDSTLTNGWVQIDSLELINFRDKVQLEFLVEAGLNTELLEAGIDAVSIFEGRGRDQTTNLSELKPMIWQGQSEDGWLSLWYEHLRPTGEATLMILDLSGKVVQTRRLEGGKGNLQWYHGLSTGMYILRLEQAGTPPASQKLMLY